MRSGLIAVLLGLMVVLSACGTDDFIGGSDPTPTPMPPGAGVGQGAAIGGQTGQTADRLIVRNGALELAFDDVHDAVQRIAGVARSHNGRVQTSRITGDGVEARGTVSIRVPSASFEQAIDDIKAFAERVEAEETISDDVTDEYVDLDAQARNLQATEAQLQTLMDRAGTVSEVLSVQRELTEVRDEIERLQGRMQLLSQTAAESLITVTLVPANVQRPLVSQTWSFMETVRAAARGLVAALQVVADVATWVAILSPLWLPVGVLAFVARRRGWFGSAPGTYGTRPRTSPPPPPPPSPSGATDV